MSSSLFFLLCFCFFFSYPATTEIYTLSLHDALPISLLMNALIDLVAQSHDWWGLFSLGLNVGYDNKDFFWSDMLHYRKTSLFGNCLWSLAASRGAEPDDDARLWSDRLKAYALGYLTHLATDTAGHPFVNEKAGGPFRTHWQRHHLIENHIDAKTHDDEHGTDVNYNMFTESAPRLA